MNTGYQRISKERATGAYDVVNKDMLIRNGPSPIVSTALQGMVPGMQGKEKIRWQFQFLVRGTSSMYADSKPLVVVDGFPVADTSFTTINPNDIESVTVLKDAAAASIWGARSANGVIVITTKQAKSRTKAQSGSECLHPHRRQDRSQPGDTHCQHCRFYPL